MKIGIFDSGLGGLVITRAFIRQLPEYDYIYYGDTKNLPYGDKTSGQILAYTLDAVKYLISQKCALIIIACNTATSITLRYLQQRFIPQYAPDVKVLGVVIPTVEEATLFNAQKIGVIATMATVRSQIYTTELHKLNPKLEVQELAAPELVPALEDNNFTKAQNLASEYVKQFKEIDSLILGCTHYPLLKTYFRQILPPPVRVISQDEFMGEKLQDYLTRHVEIDITLSRNAQYQFEVSELNEHYRQVAESLFPGTNITKKE